MTVNLAPYTLSDYEGFRCSPEVLAAIEAVTRGDLRDSDGHAFVALNDYQNELEVFDFVNAHFASKFKRGDSLYWSQPSPWVTHNGFSFVLSTRHRVLHHRNCRILFECPNDLTWERAGGTLIKEPGTIAWIDSFERGSRFWDIGANIGSFSLYAAIMRGCYVTSFEPSAENYLVLNRNVVANGSDKNVRALAVAIDDKCTIAEMHMRESLPGAALHTFNTDIDYTGHRFEAAYLQGAIGISVDSACELFGLAVPNYVKIDVDGLERAVIAGGLKTFANPECRSVLVELDLNDSAEVSDISRALGSCGLTRDENVAGNVGRAHGNVMVYNMIFRRN